MLDHAKADLGCAALKRLCDALRPDLQKYKDAAVMRVASTVGPKSDAAEKPRAMGRRLWVFPLGCARRAVLAELTG